MIIVNYISDDFNCLLKDYCVLLQIGNAKNGLILGGRLDLN